MRRTSAGAGGIHAGVNYTHAKNEVIYTGEMPYPGDGSGYKGYACSYRVDGYPLGQQFGYLVDRSNGSGYISTDEGVGEIYEDVFRDRNTAQGRPYLQGRER